MNESSARQRFADRLKAHCSNVFAASAKFPALENKFAALTPLAQDKLLHWFPRVAELNHNLGWQCVLALLKTLDRPSFDDALVENWILTALDEYDAGGLQPALACLSDFDKYSRQIERRRHAVEYTDIQGFLAYFLTGLSGRNWTVEIDQRLALSADKIVLPASVSVFDEPWQNRQFYIVVSTVLFMQWCHSASPLPEKLQKKLSVLGPPAALLPYLSLLETMRLEGRIQHLYPGLFRLMQTLQTAQGSVPPLDPAWQYWRQRLYQFDAGIEVTVDAVESLYRSRTAMPAAKFYQPGYEMLLTGDTEMPAAGDTDRPANAVHRNAENGHDTNCHEQAIQAGNFAASKESMSAGGDHQVNDLTGLQPQGIESMSPHAAPSPTPVGAVPPAKKPYQDVIYYPEWDFRRQGYRKHWCRLLHPAEYPRDPEFYTETLTQHRFLRRRIRQSFERLRNDDQHLKKQLTGDEIDIDTWVDEWINLQTGRQLSNRLYIQRLRRKRDSTVAILADMSGSTYGEVNVLQKQSLVLLCDALELVGDDYGVFGFTGRGHEYCFYSILKAFDESFGERQQHRLAGIRPGDYTRMGVFIRHTTHLLQKRETRNRQMLVLTDGRPDDYDGYKGEYGIEDTRRAVIEARSGGVSCFCIALEKDTQALLRHLYGDGHYRILEDVQRLPEVVADIYRQLTALSG